MIKSRNLAPFIHTEKTAPYIYLTHIAALLPCVVSGIVFYGIRALALMVICSGSFMILDNLFGRMVRRDGIDRNYTDFSSIESGLIYALMLPPGTSIAVALLGVLFGSFVIKQFFGGSGNNIINPACGARLLIELIVPSQLGGFVNPISSWFGFASLVGNTDSFIPADDPGSLYIIELLTGNYVGYIGMSCSVLIVMAAIYQAAKGTTRLYAPISYLTVLVILFPFVIRDITSPSDFFRSLATFMLSSGVIFVATYMLGDLTTMPSRMWGGVIAGAICAAMTCVLYGRVSVMCAVLAPVVAINFMSFEIDFFTKTIAHRGKTRQREVKVKG